MRRESGLVPTVGPDGTVYVAFENSQNPELNEAGELGRRPVPAREVDERRSHLVEPDVRRGARGRLERLPAERGRTADAHRLPGARELCRQHRREREDGRVVPHVLGQPQRHPRRGRSRQQRRRVRHELDERRPVVVEPLTGGHGSRRPVVPMGGRESRRPGRSGSRTTTAAVRTARCTVPHSPRGCRAR